MSRGFSKKKDYSACHGHPNGAIGVVVAIVFIFERTHCPIATTKTIDNENDSDNENAPETRVRGHSRTGLDRHEPPEPRTGTPPMTSQPPPDARRELHELLAGQRLAVLSTCGAGQPHASLVGFAVDAELRRLFFATDRNTRKFANLQDCPRAALLIDRRTHRPEDFQAAAAVTATGTVQELVGDERRDATAIFLARHPQLADFLAGPDCALLAMDVVTYLVVTRFQEVNEIRPA
jgi:uncharacterized protein YhbP (UPF0306 family)